MVRLPLLTHHYRKQKLMKFSVVGIPRGHHPLLRSADGVGISRLAVGDTYRVKAELGAAYRTVLLLPAHMAWLAAAETDVLLGEVDALLSRHRGKVLVFGRPLGLVLVLALCGGGDVRS